MADEIQPFRIQATDAELEDQLSNLGYIER